MNNTGKFNRPATRIFKKNWLIVTFNEVVKVRTKADGRKFLTFSKLQKIQVDKNRTYLDIFETGTKETSKKIIKEYVKTKKTPQPILSQIKQVNSFLKNVMKAYNTKNKIQKRSF